MSVDYNSTMNLPKTDFPMRGNLPQKEPEMIKRWQDQKLYQKLMEKNEGLPLYVLHDGPPYANGDIHMGTALNKVLKDIIIKYKNMSGYKAPYIPGWDTHGLPIELKAMKKVGILVCETNAQRRIGDKFHRMVELAVNAEDAFALTEPKRRSAPARYEVVNLLSSAGRTPAARARRARGRTAEAARSGSAVAGLLQKAAEKKEFPRWAGERKGGSFIYGRWGHWRPALAFRHW